MAKCAAMQQFQKPYIAIRSNGLEKGLKEHGLLKCQSAEVTADKPVRKMKAKFPRQAGWWVGAPPGPHLAHYLLTTRHGCAVAVFHECQSC